MGRYNRRVIVLVGAGASHEAGLPLATGSLKELRKNNPIADELIEREIRKLRMTSRLRPDDFETYLLAMSSTAYGADLARKELAKQYGYRHQPLLSYEIIAHLLKHRFVDAVINFNFDELLDQSIQDELRSGEYRYVLSDGDYDPTRLTDRVPIDRPFYIKPHGTVSHPSTLRFTREAYYEIPTAIFDLIRDLMIQKPVDLIVVGFSMKSPEMLEILRNRSKGLRVFYVDKLPWKTIPPGPRTDIYNIPVSVLDSSPSRVLDLVWNRVEECFEESFKPRNISRHELVSEIFSRGPKPWGPLNYLWDRTIVELCIAIARGRGFVSVDTLIRDRAGTYYEEYRREAIKHREKKPQTLLGLCSALGLQDISYANGSLAFAGNTSGDLIVPSDRRDWFLNTLLENAYEANPSPILKRYLEPTRRHRSMLKAHLRRQYDGGESELRTDGPHLYPGMFQHVTRLQTRTALRYHTLGLVGKRTWKTLLVVSEGGEWLLDPEVVDAITARKTACTKLILANAQHEEKLKDLYGDQIEIRYLAWWLHNRHMTLSLLVNGSPHDCIYLSRRLRTPELRPLLIDGDDAMIAKRTFIAYWMKAERGPQKPITPNDIDRFDDF